MKALDTEYKGFRFRSRLEARWAVFMDAMGVKYEYEREAYDLDGLFYLPDFWLPKLQSHLEIKPEHPSTEEADKAERLARHTSKPVYVFWGNPELPGFGNNEDGDSGEIYHEGYDSQHWWCECPKCGFVGIEFNGRCERLACGCQKVERYNYDSPKLQAAYARAKGYRFEPSARNAV